MRRRDFIGAIGGVAVLPLAARAQSQLRRVAIMMAPTETDPEGQARLKAFRDRLEALGWTQGLNLKIDYRWDAGPDQAGTIAAELVRLAPDVIVANGTPALTAMHQATRTIPVVFVVVVDPVGAGYVESLSRPGGNITGFSTFEPEMGTKWLELLREVAPDLRRIAVIVDPAFKGFAALRRAIENMASTLAMEFTSVPFHDPTDDIERALGTFAQQRNGGLIVLPTTVNHNHRGRIISLAARYGLPAVYPFRHYANDGGLMAYGFETNHLFDRGAVYVDRILRGQNPADLPVQGPEKFELIINVKTAKALNIIIPPTLLARADEVIE